jgi:hypothetical protein
MGPSSAAQLISSAPLPPPSLRLLTGRSDAKPFKRAAPSVASTPVTVMQLGEFRRNPRSMVGKTFIRIEDFDPNEGVENDEQYDFDDDMWMAPCNEQLYKIVGVMFLEVGNMVEAIFEGCHIPDERLLAEILELVEQSHLVHG